MTIASMRKFCRDALNLSPSEPGDVVYAGATAIELQRRADDLAAQATAKGDTTSAALWRARSIAIARVQYVAPGAVGVRWRESEDRLYFIVPGVGLVQSIEADEFVDVFGGYSDAEAKHAAMQRGISEVYRIVEGWGWSLQ